MPVWQTDNCKYSLFPQTSSTPEYLVALHKHLINLVSVFHLKFDDVFISKGAVGTNITINTLCDIMNNNDLGDPLARYAKVNSLILQTYGANCLDSSYNNLIASLRNTSWSSSASEGGKHHIQSLLLSFLFLSKCSKMNKFCTSK